VAERDQKISHPRLPYQLPARPIDRKTGRLIFFFLSNTRNLIPYHTRHIFRVTGYYTTITLSCEDQACPRLEIQIRDFELEVSAAAAETAAALDRARRADDEAAAAIAARDSSVRLPFNRPHGNRWPGWAVGVKNC